eukprot:gene2720-2970_t
MASVQPGAGISKVLIISLESGLPLCSYCQPSSRCHVELASEDDLRLASLLFTAYQLQVQLLTLLGDSECVDLKSAVNVIVQGEQSILATYLLDCSPKLMVVTVCAQITEYLARLMAERNKVMVQEVVRGRGLPTAKMLKASVPAAMLKLLHGLAGQVQKALAGGFQLLAVSATCQTPDVQATRTTPFRHLPVQVSILRSTTAAESEAASPIRAQSRQPVKTAPVVNWTMGCWCTTWLKLKNKVAPTPSLAQPRSVSLGGRSQLSFSIVTAVLPAQQEKLSGQSIAGWVRQLSNRSIAFAPLPLFGCVDQVWALEEDKTLKPYTQQDEVEEVEKEKEKEEGGEGYSYLVASRCEGAIVIIGSVDPPIGRRVTDVPQHLDNEKEEEEEGNKAEAVQQESVVVTRRVLDDAAEAACRHLMTWTIVCCEEGLFPADALLIEPLL